MKSRRPRAGIAVIAVSQEGTRLGTEIVSVLRGEHADDPGVEVSFHIKSQWQDDAPPDTQTFEGGLKEPVGALFPDMQAIVFMLPLSATVRLVAPLLGRKQNDPAVICVDDAGEFVIPVLGGDQSELNELAELIADVIGATAVVTTPTEEAGLPKLDQLGADLGWHVEATPEVFQQTAAAILAGQKPAVYLQPGEQLPQPGLPADWPRVDSVEALRRWSGPRIAITDRIIDPAISEGGGPMLVYRPRTLVLGVGCSSNAVPDEVEALARTTLAEAGLAWGSIHTVATIDRRLSHPALVQLVWQADAAFFPVYTAEELAAVTDAPSPSEAVGQHIESLGVCEPAALLASDGGTLIVPKRKSAKATVAVARRSAP